MEKREIKIKSKIQMMTLALSIMAVTSYAQEVSPYMGSDVKLTTAQNGAIVREDVLKISSQIAYTKSTLDKVKGN